jgi:hypothetical protein
LFNAADDVASRSQYRGKTEQNQERGLVVSKILVFVAGEAFVGVDRSLMQLKVEELSLSKRD